MMDGVSSGRQDDGWAAGVGLTTGWGAMPRPHPAEPRHTGTVLTCGRDTFMLNEWSVDENFGIKSALCGGGQGRLDAINCFLRHKNTVRETLIL